MAKKASAQRDVDSDGEEYLIIARERALSEEHLFEGADERGYRGWFVRIAITGLWTRRVGPFSSREAAVEFVERFLGEIVEGPLTEQVLNGDYYHVVEGVPQLSATT